MHIGQEMRRLRAEHSALATLSRMLMELVRQPRPPRPTELASVRGMLRETLVRHLKCEDWVLYPRLTSSGDPMLIRLADEFVDELGHIAEMFETYDRKWTEGAVAADWPGFCDETRVLLDLLGMRIACEEEELYPVVESLDSAIAAPA